VLRVDVSRFPPRADIAQRGRHVRFVPTTVMLVAALRASDR
jgi:hypothetical protein